MKKAIMGQSRISFILEEKILPDYSLVVGLDLEVIEFPIAVERDVIDEEIFMLNLVNDVTKEEEELEIEIDNYLQYKFDGEKIEVYYEFKDLDELIEEIKKHSEMLKEDK